jgi:trimeric autotransporter adhesin
MSFSGLRFGFLGIESRTARPRARTSQRRLIELERLEVRLVLSTSTWTGKGANANWSTAANWDVLPVSGAGTNLIFPSSALQLANVDDLGPAQTFGTLTFSGGGYSITPSNGSTASFTSIDSSQDSLSNTLDVPIALSAATIVTVDNAPASLVLGGVISGAEPLTSAGNGTLDLTADNTYTGATTVNSGTLLVDGTQTASAVSVESGATLGGVGTVASVTATGGTISPGNPAPGILTDAGALSLEASTSATNSTFPVILDGTTPGTGSGHYSQLIAGGAIGLSGVTLSGTLGSDFVPAVGSTYTILDNTGPGLISGSFSGQIDGSVIDFSGTPFSITYEGGTNQNSVVLTELDTSKTVVTFTPTAPVFGQPVALTATVTGPSGSPTPTGTVNFFSGTTQIGTATLGANGSATFNDSTLPVTTSTISATYLGNSTFGPSTSTGVSVLVAQANTSTTLTPSTTTPVFGQSVTLTATVQAVSPGAGTPTGTVEFLNGTTMLGSASLSSGSGFINTSALALGANSITVQYSGGTDFLGQTSTATTLTVGQASTATTISSSPTSPVFGQEVTITATVAVVSPGVGTPTGTVEFMNGSTPLGTATLTNGVGSVNTSILPVGNNTISTVYSGATDFAGGDSTGTVTIGQSSTSTTLTVSNPNPQANESVTLTATVAAISPGVGSPTGTVTFLNNGTSIGTATLSGGTATFTASGLPVAVNSITAQYNGDTNFSGSTSTAVPVSVGTANDQWLNQVFEILLNRPITSAEIPFWNKQFAKGRSRYSIANQISQLKEAKIAAVQDAFNLYLGENGTPAELIAAVKTAHDTSTSVQAAVLGSHTFFEASGATYTLYFQSLMSAVFGTTFPDRHIEGLLSEGVPRIRVANQLLQSNLGRQSLLTEAYNVVLQRDPTQPEIMLYLSQMKNENVLLRSIVVTLLASSEFFVKATTAGGLSS